MRKFLLPRKRHCATGSDERQLRELADMGRLRGIASSRFPPGAPPPSAQAVRTLLWVWEHERHALEKGCGQETLERWAEGYPRVTMVEPHLNCRQLRRALQWLCKTGAAETITGTSDCAAYRLLPHAVRLSIKCLE